MTKMEDNTTCKDCGQQIVNENSFERSPCPNCGSLSRNYSVNIIETITATDFIKTDVTLVDSSIILQSVVVPEKKTSEGLLISAVSIPWFDIIDCINRNPGMVFQISHEKWEEIIAGAYKQAGFDKVILTPRSGDFGRDVIAIKKGLGEVRIIDQVKAYKPDHLVSANDIRALMGVLQTDGASKGFVTTTSDFAPRISKDPLIQPWIPQKLELINGIKLIPRLQELALNKNNINKA